MQLFVICVFVNRRRSLSVIHMKIKQITHLNAVSLYASRHLAIMTLFIQLHRLQDGA